ncbi:MAG TPA: ribonuclease HII [Candidatus Saccharimonadales bacterium]|nr:ribonuclease HII [Candidatus Saccharimonadales bacterium]
MVTVGIDEVGRGCWAGPLVAAAVILPANSHLEDCPLELKDSKKLSGKQRNVAAVWLHQNAVALGIGWVWPAQIDAKGLSWAVGRAMELALAEISAAYDEVIIDGNINYFAGNPRARAVVKADDSVPCVSAASIVAKVARDAYMADLDKKYAGYGFEKHVGYGTAAHIAALELLGVSDIHRRSYKPIRELLA